MKKWLLIGLVVVAVGGYLLYQQPEVRHFLEQQTEQVLPSEVTHTTVYKWQDKTGQWQITNSPPPAGVKYETIQYRKDTNVIPAERLTGKKTD